jgi:hypothetical protein
VTLRTWHPDGPNGQVERKTDIMPHHEVLLRLDAMDLDRGLMLVANLFYQVLRTAYQGPRLQVTVATSSQMMVSILIKL